jgi:hypothetical protein
MAPAITVVTTPHTDRKLRKARFFLHHLKNTSALEEPFLFYLSACLTASSSVLSVLRTECRIKKKAFTRWRDTLPKDERELLDSMIGRRDEEVHKTPANPEIHLVPAIPVLDHRRRLGRMEVFAPPITDFKAIRFLYVSGRPTEIINACTRFIALLEKLTQEFSQVPVNCTDVDRALVARHTGHCPE